MVSIDRNAPKAFLIGVELISSPGLLDVESSLYELSMLADTAGLHVVGQAVQKLKHPDPATYIRSGKVEEVRMWIEELSVEYVIVDDELSPRHQRELEKALGENIHVMDRTALILDIFAAHARTREGALQVELAQYEYRLPRLTRQWTHLARQAGGGAARGGSGGVGLRGPGETQLETDRRIIGQKISRLKKQIEAVRSHRERHREQRRHSGIPVVALVGYTNAGKSTLLNALSEADVYVADQLFATLDPTTRRIILESGREVLVSDTVGFIQKLPHNLIAAFRATLEEIEEASVLLHIVDSSHPNAYEHIQVVENMLDNDLSVSGVPVILVLNKSDLAPEETHDLLDRLVVTHPLVQVISAKAGAGLEDLLVAVDTLLAEQEILVTVHIPYAQSRTIARFYDVSNVQNTVNYEAFIEITGHLNRRYLSEFEGFVVNV
ncbi:MAG: GTPase HflX [Anaerolineae bacterium]|nr:GTPase HflX [Anaerolineae bacterium]